MEGQNAALAGLRHLDISPERITFVQDIYFARGGFGEVRSAKLDAHLDSDARIVAVKELRPAGHKTERMRMTFVREQLSFA